MSGYPTRPTRSAFGPVPVNRYPVRDPSREVDGPTVGDLMLWTIAGSGVVVPQAWAVVRVIAGPDWELVASAETWDANGAVVPTILRTGVGTGTITYASTYPDKDAVDIATNFLGVAIDEQVLVTTKEARAQVNANPYVVDVALFLSGIADDWTTGDEFLVRMW